LSPSTAPRWKIVIRVLRLPPLLPFKAAALANWCRKPGATLIKPKLAKPIPLAFKKYLLSIIAYLKCCLIFCKNSFAGILDAPRAALVVFIFPENQPH
jgi:hypothetical protein